VERWAAVVDGLVERGHRVVVTGTAAERDATDELARRSGLPTGRNLAGRTTVRQLFAVVAASRLVLSGDTGVAHAATALRVPSVTLFGPVSPERWGPPPREPRHCALWHGRLGDPHAAEPDQGLLAITPTEVLRAADGVALDTELRVRSCAIDDVCPRAARVEHTRRHDPEEMR
jgi:ADP-heptose:LPS heptosyltransferase